MNAFVFEFHENTVFFVLFTKITVKLQCCYLGEVDNANSKHTVAR